MNAPILLILLLVACTACAAAPLVIARDGVSTYCLYRAPDAPEPVQEAARELARVLLAASGATLPVVDAPKSPMICLGDNAAARAAGLQADKLPEEGFRIEAKGVDVFIVGHDTPDGAFTPGGGCSQGTLFGAYEFLERFAGVRWLMPEEVGEDIPRVAELTVDGLPLAGQPDMSYRTVPYLQRRASVGAWSRRLRLGDVAVGGRQGCAVWMAHNHVWDKIPGAEVIGQHPEYAALVGGQRVKPEGRTYKLCTTNPGLIQAFADKLMETMAANPDRRMFTISPTDGQGWCECPQCTALDEPTDPKAWPGSAMLPKNMTRRLCTFYNAVAKLVRPRFPDKLLGAYLYYEYAYPPAEPMAMEPNLFFMLATRAYYGATLYRPELAAEFPRLIAWWSAHLPGRLAYYDLPTKLIPSRVGFIGAPQPSGTSLFKVIFPALQENHVPGALVYGMEWWGTAGAHNYVLARLLWDNDADPVALRDEWLSRAYGPAAAEPMRRLDDLLDAGFRAYKQNPNDWQWRFMPDLVSQLYAPKFAEIEALYLEALGKADTPARRARLEMFGDNLIVLHWNLRQAGLLPEPEASKLYRSDEEYRRFVKEKSPSLALYPGPERQPGVPPLLTPQLVPPKP